MTLKLENLQDYLKVLFGLRRRVGVTCFAVTVLKASTALLI